MKQRQKDRHRSTMVLIPALLITASVLPGDHPSFPRGRPEKTRSAPAVQVSTSIARTTRQRIELIEARLREKPSDPGLLAALASAYMNRARVTSEASWYSRAEAACRKSLEIAPGNYDALRLQPWILAGQHRFAEAAEAAKAILGSGPRIVSAFHTRPR